MDARPNGTGKSSTLFGKMENETERDALAMQILGKSAQELNPLIEAGSARMQELGEQAEAAGYVMSWRYAGCVWQV